MTTQFTGATRAWILVIATVLLAGTVAASGPTYAISRENLNQAQLATAKIQTLSGQNKVLYWCSATVVHPRGYLVLPWTCIGLTTREQDDSGQGLAPGDLYHPNGLVIVSPTRDPRQAPAQTYMARVVAGSPAANVAVLKITGMFNPQERLPGSLTLVSAPMGDSDKIRDGDPAHLVGYATQGALIGTASTTVNGFEDGDGDGTADEFTTPVESRIGTGATALNDAGQMIGSFLRGERSGAITMSNLVVPYINNALKADGLSPLTGGGNVPPPGPVPGATPFGPLRFGADVNTSTWQLIGPASQFATGARKVVAQWDYQNMRDGTRWGYVWTVDGHPAVDKPNLFSWEGGSSGVWNAWVTNDQGLPDGKWEVALYIQNKEVQRGSFSIGGGQRPPPRPPAPTDEGVTIKGMIVDADTRRPIPGAMLGVFKPGVTVDQIDSAGDEEFDSLIAAFGEADQSGTYQTRPPLKRGQTYTAIAVAKGYARRVFESGLKLAPDEPAVWEAEPIALKKR